MQLCIDRIQVEERTVCACVERTDVPPQSITGPRSRRGGNAEDEKHESSTCEPSRGSCPGPAHEGGTVPQNLLETGNFVPTCTRHVLLRSQRKSRTFPYVCLLRASDTPASLLDL